MVYLEQFRFPDAEVEFDFFLRQKRTCYDTYIHFKFCQSIILSRLILSLLRFYMAEMERESPPC